MRLGLLFALSIIVAWLAVIASWWQGVQDQWGYSNTRITQLGANVGQGGVGHFIAEYYNHEIVIIELPLSKPNTHHVYTLTGLL